MSEPVDAELMTAEGEVLPAVRAATMVRAAPGDVIEAFREYQQIQQALDKQLPNSIQEIRGKRFRKKNYWRAIATAFNLTVEERREERRDEEGGDWGYLATYRAIATNGRYADGDGSCFASEKASGQDTLHNVRSHAHTRAFNRAVSNLVGFGEVSAEEMEREEWPRKAGHYDERPRPAKSAPPASGEAQSATEEQAFLYQPGDPPPPSPKFAAWHRDAPTKNTDSEFSKTTWAEMMKGSYGGRRYKWCRRVLAMPSPPASTAERARVVVWGIEQKELSRRADLEAAKESGDAAPF
jgi:hypothetical protein